MNVVIVAQSHPSFTDPEAICAPWSLKLRDVSLSGLGVALDCLDHPPGDLALKSAQVVF